MVCYLLDDSAWLLMPCAAGACKQVYTIRRCLCHTCTARLLADLSSMFIVRRNLKFLTTANNILIDEFFYSTFTCIARLLVLPLRASGKNNLL